VDIIRTVLYPRPLTCLKEFLLFYMCQLWALHVVTKRHFFTFIYVRALKLLCNAYQFTHQISASFLNYFLKYEGGPKIQDDVAVVRMHHLVEKISTLLKLLIISIHILNFSLLTQLLPEIWTGILYLPLV